MLMFQFTMLSGKVPFHAKSTTESANEIIARCCQSIHAQY